MGALRWQIQEHCITGIMKLLLLFAAIGYTSAAVTCDECKDAAAGLVDRLTSEASIAEQTEVLIAALCPASPDPVMCEKGMNMWWGAMAHCLYPHFIGAGDVCSSGFLQEELSALPAPGLDL